MAQRKWNPVITGGYATNQEDSGYIMANPKVTVLMSVYNGERFLRESMDSILSQTFKDFEFLIVNDGSTDRTKEILESYNDPRISIINNDKNIGLTRSLNKGLALAKGEYIARMDADDISLPERLEKQVEFLDTNPSIGVLGIKSNVIDEKGNTLFQVKHPESHADIMAKLLLDNRFIHSSVIMRKLLLDKYGYYNEELPMAQDYELFLGLSHSTQFANLSEPLHQWRKNTSTGISVLRRQEQIAVRDRIRRAFLKKNFSSDRGYVDLILNNLRHNPRDAILLEYLKRAANSLPFTAKLSILKSRFFGFIFFYVRCLIRKLMPAENGA